MYSPITSVSRSVFHAASTTTSISRPIIQKEYRLRAIGPGDTHACTHFASVNWFDEARLRPCRFQRRTEQVQRLPAMVRWSSFKRSQPVQQSRSRHGQRADWNLPPRHRQQTAIVRRMPINHEHILRRRSNHPLRGVVEANGSTIDKKNAASRRRFPRVSRLKLYGSHRKAGARESPNSPA